MKVLAVEDDIEIARQLEISLKGAGYVVDIAHDGEEGFHKGRSGSYDLIFLDLGLPTMDGMSVLEKWRSEQITTPVIILTARDTWREKVDGLRAGADDYISKPFETEEVLARAEALIRRTSGHAHAVLSCGAVELDTTNNRVTLKGELIEMTALELGMLSYLIHHKGDVISKATLTDHIYEEDADRDSNVIEVLVNRLRKKLGNDIIKTHRGLGYQLVEPAS